MFYLIIGVQVLLLIRGIYCRDRLLILFSFLSAALTLLLFGFMEFSIHHLLRNSYSIPNTAVYLLSFLIIAAFAWTFRELLQKNNYNLLLMGSALWILSGGIDLLTDAEIVTIIYNDIFEDVFALTGSIFYLIFYISLLLKTYSLKVSDRTV